MSLKCSYLILSNYSYFIYSYFNYSYFNYSYFVFGIKDVALYMSNYYYFYSLSATYEANYPIDSAIFISLFCSFVSIVLEGNISLVSSFFILFGGNLLFLLDLLLSKPQLLLMILLPPLPGEVFLRPEGERSPF